MLLARCGSQVSQLKIKYLYEKGLITYIIDQIREEGGGILWIRLVGPPKRSGISNYNRQNLIYFKLISLMLSFACPVIVDGLAQNEGWSAGCGACRRSP